MIKLQLKGCLWKPGINGLGVRGLHCLPYRKRFDCAARNHDKMYDCGGTWKDRRRVDIIFLGQCVNCSRTTFQVTVSVIYFYAVRLLGWAFFRYDKQL